MANFVKIGEKTVQLNNGDFLAFDVEVGGRFAIDREDFDTCNRILDAQEQAYETDDEALIEQLENEFDEFSANMRKKYNIEDSPIYGTVVIANGMQIDRSGYEEPYDPNEERFETQAELDEFISEYN